MVSKPINLPGLPPFPMIKDAKAHFEPMLKNTPVGQNVTPQQFAELKILYEAYCKSTNWKMPGTPIAFAPMLEQQPGYTTKCFAVEFSNGDKKPFSLDKALKEVAK